MELERETGRGGQYKTRIKWTGEELQPNLSLQKKLEELNIDLPDLEEEQDLETYLTEVAQAVRHKPDWLVRRYVTLGLFEFGKILLYLDLDPDRWPTSAPLADHRLVREVLGGPEDAEGVEDEGTPWLPEGDQSPKAVEARDLTLEVVDRADSSQCEALEVALSGRNLVVQGPPGTGKSQTITNLVAAALARGKTVLFVAEKLAALEVVRRRMRELGLGDFCLELHSHKTRKMEVVEDIGARIRAASRIRPPKEYAGALSRLADRRRKLSDYIDIVGLPAAGFENLSVSDALMRAGQARRKLGEWASKVDELRDYFTAPSDLNAAALQDAKGRLKLVANAIDELEVEDSAFSHVWAGVSSTHVFPQDRERVARLANEWADKADALSEVIGDPWLRSMQLSDLARSEGDLKNLQGQRSSLLIADEAAGAIEAALGIGLERSSQGADVLAKMIDLAAGAPLQDLKTTREQVRKPGAAAHLRQHEARLSSLRSARDGLVNVFREAAQSADIDDLEEWAAALSQRGLFAPLGKRWRVAKESVSGLFRPAYLGLKAPEKAAHLERLRAFLIDLKALRSNRKAEELLGPIFAELDQSVEGQLRVADWCDRCRALLAAPAAGRLVNASTSALAEMGEWRRTEVLAALRAVGQSASGPATSFWALGVRALVSDALVPAATLATAEGNWSQLCDAVSRCAAAAQAAMKAEADFVTATGLNEADWFGAQGRPHLEGISSQARLAAAHVDELPRWLDFDRAFRSADTSFEAPIAMAAANGDIPTSIVGLALDFLVFDAIARDAFADNPTLLTTSGKSLDVLREEYAAIDAEVMELRRAHIAATLLTRRPPEGRSSGRKSDLTEMALIRAELAKQKRHIPIRQLVNRAGRALQALKPCFMMGPLSVAQYIAPGALKFDLIIMDEASQMRPEDAIGALARGGQAVIVGDTKQLPPTSFFDRISDSASDEEDEDLTLAEDSKSILELAEAIFTPRMLRWHYRSRHESLIAFSNKQFYRNDLIVFPSPSGQDGRYGVGWRYLDQGVTTSGVNPVEARAVAKAAALALLNDQRRTVGVVAMNIKQAQRISDELAAMAKDDPVLAKVLNEAENSTRGEPFFVKNLENVQGDERDVIIISMTYGPREPGKPVPQNFGPINLETGWRRLNVLFTRAKERMEVFSSMRASDIVPKEGGDRGPRALKLFLDYAETGRLGEEANPTGRGTDSDFEDAVIEGLTELNFQCVPQVGVANFFLDIGIRDPNAPHEFIAAVECDGATYHSSRSARDRDRLRQEILENLGWNIIRIWSTDWFRDPKAELEKASAKLKQYIAAAAAKRARPSPAEAAPSKAAVPKAPKQGDLSLDTATTRKPARSGARLSLDQARAELIDLRENTIKVEFPDADPARGLLRKSMLDELLRKRPKDHQEFLAKLPLELRQNTDADQLKAFGEQVFEILERTS